jgi:protein-disulfide isomerase
MSNKELDTNTVIVTPIRSKNSQGWLTKLMKGSFFTFLLLITLANLGILAGGGYLLWNNYNNEKAEIIDKIQEGNNKLDLLEIKVDQTLSNSQEQALPTGAAASSKKVSIKTPDLATDQFKGNPNSKIVLITYTDLQCPFCKNFHQTLRQLQSEQPDTYLVVYRHNPLTQIHPQAEKLALTSECIAKYSGKEKFWNFVDDAFNDGFNATNFTLDKYQSNKTEIEKCVQNKEVGDKVNKDRQEAQTSGFTGTPMTVVMNLNTNKNTLVEGAQSKENLLQSIKNISN